MAQATDDWASWLQTHGPALVLFARQWVGQRSDAEEVVQEAFVRFWRSRSAARDQTAYLFACVKRSALDWLRSRRRRQHREGMAARSEAAPLLSAPLELAERRRTIEAALHLLPEPQREVLVLKIWAGLTFAQIAETLEVPIHTVASRYRYALEKLREPLAEEVIP